MRIAVVTPPMLKPSEPGLSGASAAQALRRLGANAVGIDASIEWHRFALAPDRLAALLARASATNAEEGNRAEAFDPGVAKPDRATGGPRRSSRGCDGSAKRRGALEAMRRATRGFAQSPLVLERAATYQSRARYSAAVADLEQALRLLALPYPGVRLGVAMYALDDGRRLESSGVLAEIATTPGPFDDYFTSALLPRLEREGVTCVAVSLTFQQQGPAAFRLARLLRERLPAVERVLGGPLVACWRPLGVDFSRAPFDLFERVMAGSDDDLAALARTVSGMDAAGTASPVDGSGSGELAGIGHPAARDGLGRCAGRDAPEEPGLRRSDLLQCDPRAPNLDEIRWPLYLAPLPVVPAAFGRGCYWRRCTFCPDHLHPGHRPCSAEGVTRFLHEVASHFPGGAMVHWTDSALPVEMLEHVADVIRKDALRIGWHGFVRVEPELSRPETAERLAAGGCAMLQLGVETGSARLLDLLGKGGSPELTRAVLRTTAAAGIRNQIYLLFGLPTETDSDREETLALVESTADATTAINPALLNLPRGSRMHRRAGDFGITEIVPFGTQTDLSLYDDFRCGKSHPRLEARKWLAHRFFKAPSVRRIRSELRAPFKANHLCFIEAG